MKWEVISRLMEEVVNHEAGRNDVQLGDGPCVLCSPGIVQADDFDGLPYTNDDDFFLHRVSDDSDFDDGDLDDEDFDDLPYDHFDDDYESRGVIKGVTFDGFPICEGDEIEDPPTQADLDFEDGVPDPVDEEFDLQRLYGVEIPE